MLEKPGTITAIFADPHIGGSTALSLPHWMLIGKKGEEIPYEANLAQKWIYENWVNYWQYICYRAGVNGKYRKHRIISINVGDVVDGIHHDSIQCLHNIDDQLAMASEIFTRIANLSDGGLYMVVGTEAHSGQNGTHEYTVASRCGARFIDQSLLLDIDGTVILAYHKGRAGARPQTSASAGIAVEAIVNAVDNKEPIPRYVFTAHNHKIDNSGQKLECTEAVSLPSWQLRTAFGWMVAPHNSRSDIGGMVMLPGGILDWSHARYKGAPGQRKLIIA